MRPPTHPAVIRRLSLATTAIACALVMLLVACLGAPLGTPVADDYSFLAYRLFEPPDLFSSAGAYGWRPVGRQAYFALVGPWLLNAPLAAALLHVAILALTAALVYRIFAVRVGRPVAAAIAAAIVISEPARVLIGWPSGAQHLMAGLAAVLALHEALAGRFVTSGAAALIGVLCAESAVLVLPLLPLSAWESRRDRRGVLAAFATVAVVVLVWLAGYAVALRHGVQLPGTLDPNAVHDVSTDPGTPIEFEGAAGFPEFALRFGQATIAALDLEDVHGPARWVLAAAYLTIILVAMIGLARGTRDRRALAIVVIGLAGYIAGVALLAVTFPYWSAWRAWIPTLGFTIATIAFVGAAHPWLAAIWVAIRLAALLASPSRPLTVSGVPPDDASGMSFRQLVRLQHIVSGTRDAVLSTYPKLPPGGAVCYWKMPMLAEFAFQGSRALQVWYGDSTLHWTGFGGREGAQRRFVAGVEFRYDDPRFVRVIPAPPIAMVQDAMRAIDAGHYAVADALLEAANVQAGDDRGPFAATIAVNGAISAYNQGNRARTDSLLRIARDLGSDTPLFWGLVAQRAAERGDRVAAVQAVRAALAIDSTDPRVNRLARLLGEIP